jgi:hypothetical protein
MFGDFRDLAKHAAASRRRAHIGAIEIFPQIHQCKKGAEDAGFEVIGKRHAAGRDASQSLAIFSNEAHDFALALVRSVAQRGFATHFRAAGLQRKRVMEHAQLLLLEWSGSCELATCNLAGDRHLFCL